MSFKNWLHKISAPPEEKSGMTINQLLDELRNGSSTTSGVRVTDDRALMLSAVFGCVRVLAFTASYLPWRLFRVARDGSKELAFDHPVHRLINIRPNSFQTPATFKVFKSVCELNKGNFYGLKVRDNKGRVVEVLPLNPNDVEVKRLDNWEKEFTVRYPNGKTKKYTSYDIYHSFLLTLNGWSGVSILRYAREAIGQGLAMQEYGAALFANGARPDIVVELPHGKTNATEAVKSLKEDWKKGYQGPKRAGRPLFIENGSQLHTVDLNNDDVQFLETKGFTRTEICGFYGVPPHLIGDLSNATFSNIEHQDLSYLKYGLLPWINNDEESLRLQLLDRFETANHVIDVDESLLMRGDLKAQTEYLKVAVGRPIETVDEARRKRGQNPIDGGGVLGVQPGIGTGSKKENDNDKNAD